MKIIYKVQNFIEDWIYPAYYLRNILFHKYNRVKFPSVKSYEFLEDSDRMFYAVFELIHNFVNHLDDNPTLWKGKDQKTGEELGSVYGDNNSSKNILYTELKGKYIIDLIKEIDNFYTKELPELNNTVSYMKEIFAKYFYIINWDNMLAVDDGNDNDTNAEVYELDIKRNDYSKEELSKFDIDWDKFLKYTSVKSKDELCDSESFCKALTEVENYIFDRTQYYLHLAIEVRNYLWS